MRLRYFQPTRLYCFSPPVMMATFLFEIGAAIYTVWRYKLDVVTRLVVAILVCLAIFQLAEYNVCEVAWGLDSSTWSRIGYVAITFLPPLGLHLVLALARRVYLPLVASSYMLAVGFASYFVLATVGIAGQQCMGNYVIFQVAPDASLAHSYYYWLLLMVGVGMCSYEARRARAARDVYTARALNAFAVGYLLFMTPTIVAIYLVPEAMSAIPSIMCGFAVMLAIVLVGWVLPNYRKSQAKTKSSPSVSKRQK